MDIKIKKYKIKTGINVLIFILLFVTIVCNSLLCGDFSVCLRTGSNPVYIYICFEAMMDKVILVNLPHTLLSLKSYFLYMSEYVRYALAKKRCSYKPKKKIRKILTMQVLVYIEIKIINSIPVLLARALLGLGLTKLVLIL